MRASIRSSWASARFRRRALALERAGLTLADLDVIEANEAFAAQACAVAKELGFDPAKINPNGSGISLGHPVGATGAILTVKALYELQRIGGRYALVTMCIGGGQGIAAIFERYSRDQCVNVANRCERRVEKRSRRSGRPKRRTAGAFGDTCYTAITRPIARSSRRHRTAGPSGSNPQSSNRSLCPELSARTVPFYSY